MRNGGRVVSREMLARDVWKETGRATPLDNVIDVHIARLRRKVDDAAEAKLIHTVRGVGFMIGESTYDPAKKVVTGYMEGPDMTGKVVKSKSVVEYKADGSRVFTMYNRTPDGKEVAAMRITYVKRK